jgi:two-component system response regulator (stage 0 sporulation protein F)
MKKILYVDDEEMNLMLFETMFSKTCNVKTASNGQNALKLLREIEKPEVVISDMRMPGMDGLEFISKAAKEYPDIDYYILSGFEISQKVHEALNSGLVKKYFQKPFRKHELESILV